MAGKIFVNYRRDDERAMAARIRDRLAQTFGEANVFMDVDNLLAGQRFDRELEKALGQTDVFLAVIGPRWMGLLAERQASGERDYVREEIAGALQRGIVVIPVLIERTPLPRADALPEDIRDLVLHQKHEVTHERFGRDVGDLVEAIRLARRAARAGGGGGGSAVRWVGAAVLAALMLGGGVLAYQGLTPDRGVEVKRQEDRVKVAAEKAKQVEIKRVADAATAKNKADEEAQAKRAAEEAEHQRLAMLKAEQERKRVEENRKPAKVAAPPAAAAPVAIAPDGPEVTLRMKGGGFELKGRLKAYDGGRYVIDSRKFGTMTLDASNMECIGAGCPGGLAAAIGPSPDQLRPGRVFRDCPDCPEMVVLPAGEFMMGSPASETGRDADEGPQRRVTIQRPFAVGKFEVTFAEWDACVAANGCSHRPDDRSWGRSRRPVINVSWHDAKGYAAWLSGKAGKNYRLLSEAEWEYAARAGTTTRYAFGDTISKGQARYSADKTVEVGSFPANKFGLHDLHGNVWEWCEDNWHPNYEGAPIDGSMWSGGDVSLRVLRGGSWHFSFPDNLPSAIRNRGQPDFRYVSIGFRLSRTL